MSLRRTTHTEHEVSQDAGNHDDKELADEEDEGTDTVDDADPNQVGHQQSEHFLARSTEVGSFESWKGGGFL